MTTVLLVSAQTFAEDETTSLTWRGCGISKKAFMEGCAKEYEKTTGVSIVISGGGATLGIEAAREGGADFGGTCRGCIGSLNECETNLNLSLVAWDALVVVTHPSNPIQSITKDQLVNVLKQKTTDWKDLGGEAGPIVVLARKGRTSGVGHMTRRLVFGDADVEYGPTVIRLVSSGPVEKMLERTPTAIAVTGISSAKRRNLKIVSIDGIEPTKENIASGAYPYYRPLYLAYSNELSDEARGFLDWILSPPGQAIIDEQGTVTLEAGRRLIDSFEHFEDTSIIDNYQQLLAESKKSISKQTVTADPSDTP